VLDLVTAEHDSLVAHVFLGDGKSGFAAAPSSPLALAAGIRPHTHALALADMNGDRHLDVLSTNADGNSVSVLLGDGKASFAPAKGSPFRAAEHPYDALAIADMNGDAKLDVVVPNMTIHRVSVLAGDGTGALAAIAGSPFQAGPRPGYALVADLDGMAQLDIVATHDDDPLLAVLIADGHGGFSFGKGGLVELPERAWGIASGDLDRDGVQDLVLGTHGERGPLILYGAGYGSFAAPERVAEPSGRAPSRVVLADLDGDGRLDILTGNYESGDVSAYLAREAAK
jgi:hypothetical protein